MTDEQLAAIEARANAATKGPWGLLPDGVSRKPPNNCPIVFRADTDLRYIAFCRDVNEWNQGEPTDNLANATFITHARDDIPALIAEVRRLREVIGKLPLTADGVPVVPGMRVYPELLDDDDDFGLDEGGIVVCIGNEDDDSKLGIRDCRSLHIVEADASNVYSTRQAAERAAGEAK